MFLPLPRLLATIAVACLTALGAAGAASAEPHLPPAGKVWHGVASGTDVADFEGRVGKHPAVWQQWIQWGGSFEFAFGRAVGARTRLMLHLSTAPQQNRAGRISPGQIARGEGDGYLLELNRALARHGRPVYLRLMGEMNNCDLAYSSHDCSGRRRDADHAPARFKQAWRRTVLVLRGGSVAEIDARLARLGMPALRTGAAQLDAPPVAFVWSPMTGGSPMIRALRPAVFWPGSQYVDWVGTSFYSKFPNFHFLEPYYRAFAARYGKPFVFTEWAMWGSDAPAFARRLFSWVRTHRQVRMMVYNQGADPVGPFRLRHFPRAQSVIRRAISSPRFVPFAAETLR
jgi:hypothetical protein